MTSESRRHPPQLPNSYEIIWDTVCKIPKGKVATYGGVAEASGLPGQARLVGYALHNLPLGSPIPWQRVVNARGQITFPKDSRNYRRQEALLKEEGIRFVNGKIDLERFGW